MEYRNGFINLEEVNCQKGETISLPGKVRIDYNSNLVEVDGKDYYAKRSSYNYYGELIAEEIAKQMNIPCSNYDLAYYNENVYLLSEVNDKINTYSIDYLIKSVYQTNNTSLYNNLEDIRSVIDMLFLKRDISGIKDELNNIYAFDIIIANPDRNPTNLKVYDNGVSVHFAPLYDNENCFSHEETTYDSNYTLGVHHDKKEESDLYSFLNLYSDMIPILERNLDILTESNMQKIFLNIELRIKGQIPDKIKERYLHDANMNLRVITKTINIVKENKIKSR